MLVASGNKNVTRKDRARFALNSTSSASIVMFHHQSTNYFFSSPQAATDRA